MQVATEQLADELQSTVGDGAAPAPRQRPADRSGLAPQAALDPRVAGADRCRPLPRAPCRSGVCGLGYRSGLQISLLYLLPIIAAALRFRWRGGVIVALAAALLTHLVNEEDLLKKLPPAALVVNTFTESAIFALTALVTGTLQAQRQRLQEQRRELAEAQHRMQADLQAAGLLQAHLLHRPLPEIPGLDLAAELRFARGVGGDFYDLRRIDGCLLLCLADVSGKGRRRR